MRHIYTVFVAAAFSFFARAQYNAYSLFDEAAAQHITGRPGTGARSIFHK
jgi:hypothetical protein